MKKIFILILIMVISFVVVFFFNNSVKNSVEKDILNGMNGIELSEKTNKKVISFVKEYQEENFVNAEDYYVIYDSVDKFNEYSAKAKEIEILLEQDPFTVVENLDIYDPYYEDVSVFYDLSNSGLQDVNAEYLEEINGKFCIKYGNITFDNNEFMVIRKGKFVATILKTDINKRTLQEARDGMYIRSLGKQSVNGNDAYYFYDEFNNEEIIIEIDIFAGIIRGIKRV